MYTQFIIVHHTVCLKGCDYVCALRLKFMHSMNLSKLSDFPSTPAQVYATPTAESLEPNEPSVNWVNDQNLDTPNSGLAQNPW